MVLDGTGSVYDDTGWYLVSISWYCLVLGGTGPAKGLYACIYLAKVEIWSGVADASLTHTHTHRQQNVVLLSLSLFKDKLSSTIFCCLESIKFKLSHAMSK